MAIESGCFENLVWKYYSNAGEAAKKLTQVARYERSEARQGCRSGHYNRNLTTTSGDFTLHVPCLKGTSFGTTMAHTPDENGEILLEGLLGRNWAPGFFHIAGYLYYADEAGNLLRDADDGAFHFLPDGRYTSGDEELDAMVAALLADWIAETPEAEDDALLQKAYLYVLDMTYTSGNHYDFGATGWDVEEGKKMLSNHHNNCYGYAGAFCALARYGKSAILRGMNYAPPPQAGNVTTRSEDIKVGYKVHAPMSPSKSGPSSLCPLTR